MHAVLAAQIPGNTDIIFSPVSALAAIDEATAAALQRMKVPATNRLEAVVYAATAVSAKRAFGGGGRDDGGSDGYAHALHASLAAAI
jgi:hypothetical protein|mmetsp:Transcript_30403/g.76065  ORF Transcript_30403/g.76065 Transcript_30403/m.76065 type:complete len:87 (+) Transcript_30403:1256-1516(+)